MLRKITKRLELTFGVFVDGVMPSDKQRNIPAISPEEVEEARIFFPLDKFFIFGHARSGTTLLTRLIRLHPDSHCNYQGHFFTRKPTLEGLVNRAEIQEWFTRRSNRWNRGRDLSPIVLRAISDFVMEREARPMGVKVVGDKSPNSLMDGESVKLAHKIYPDGRIIYIVRDGRDAAVSHRFQTFIDATQHLNRKDWKIRKAFEYNPESFMQGTRSIFTEKGIRAAAKGWVKNVSETTEIGNELYGDQFISLRYEDLLTNPWDQISRLWKFLGLEVEINQLKRILESELERNPDRDWQKKKAGNLVSPLEKGKSGSWRELFSNRDRDIFKEIADKTLQDWGYTW